MCIFIYFDNAKKQRQVFRDLPLFYQIILHRSVQLERIIHGSDELHRYSGEHTIVGEQTAEDQRCRNADQPERCDHIMEQGIIPFAEQMDASAAEMQTAAVLSCLKSDPDDAYLHGK